MCPRKIISRLDSESKSNETLREEQEVRADVAFNTLGANSLKDFNTLEANSLKDLMFHSIVKTSQELRMLSSVTLNCQATKIVMDSGSQW